MTNPLKFWMVEMCSAVPSDASVVESTGASYDSSFARCGFSVPGGQSAASVVFSSETIMWFHLEIDAEAFNSGEHDVFEIKNSGGTIVFKIVADVFTPDLTHTRYKLYTYNGSGYTQVGSSYDVTRAARQRLDLKVDAVNLLCELKFAGTVRISGSINAAVDNFAQVLIHGTDSTASSFSQVFGATEDTVNLRLITVTGTANGADQDQASGDYASVDETVLDDADFVAFTAAGRFTAKKTTFSTSYLIRGVGVSLRCNTTGSGPAHIQPLLRVAGANYEDATLHALSGSTGVAQYMWGQNPASGTDWLSAAVAATEFGAHLTA